MNKTAQNPEIVHLYDIAKEDSHALLRGGLDERTTYFWSHVAYCSNMELKKEMPHVFTSSPGTWSRLSVQNNDLNSPKILACHSENTFLITVMGTKRSEDLKAVLDFAFDGDTLMQKIERAYESTFKNVTHSDMLLEIVLEYLYRLPKKARVHPGIFFRAYQALNLVWQYLESQDLTSTPQSVYLYGHSLGAACVTLVFVWLRDIYYKGGRDIFGTLQIKCGCIACPMFCDDLAWYEWFYATSYSPSALRRQLMSSRTAAKLDTLDLEDQSIQIQWSIDNYRHFYTFGDVFVRDIPSLAAYTRAFSNVHYVCPDASEYILSVRNVNDARRRGGSTPSFNKMLVTHSSLQEMSSRRVYVKLSGTNMPPRPPLSRRYPRVDMQRSTHITRSCGLK